MPVLHKYSSTVSQMEGSWTFRTGGSMWTIDHLISIFNNDWRVFGNVLKKQRGAFYFEKRHLRPTWRGKLLPVVVRCSFCLTDSSRWRCGAEPVCGKGLKRSGMLPVETQTRCCGRRECLMEMLGKAGGGGGGGGNNRGTGKWPTSQGEKERL